MILAELPLLAGFVFGIIAPTAPSQTAEPFCACVDLGSAVDTIRRVATVDWSTLDRTALAQIWPQARPLPCETSPLTGIAAVTEAIERCCASCGTCGGPVFAAVGSPTLRSIPISICRHGSYDELSDLKRMVDATVPAQLDASYEEGWSLSEDLDHLYNGYRWRANGNSFILDVDLGRWDNSWVGSYELTRCGAVTELETWVLDDGTRLAVTELEVKNADDGERELWFSYQTSCLIRDGQCLQSEWAKLWPRLRSVAEHENTTTVFLSSENCDFDSMTIYPKRNSLGRWELPWPW